MATTYTQAKATLDEIAQRSEQNRKRLQQARNQVATAEADLAAMATAYGPFVTDLDAAVTANPGDAAWQAAGAEKDQMVSDFNALKAQATAVKNAIDSA